MMNSNLLSLGGFKLQIDSEEFSHTQYYAVSASFPAVSISEVSTSFRNNQAFVSGEKLNYDPLTLRIAIDEGLVSYREIFNWMYSNTTGSTITDHNMTLHFLTNHNNISRSVRFYRAFPTNLGGIEFNVQQTDPEYAFVDVTFRYDNFEFLD